MEGLKASGLWFVIASMVTTCADNKAHAEPFCVMRQQTPMVQLVNYGGEVLCLLRVKNYCQWFSNSGTKLEKVQCPK